jgi:O-antigen ligase
VGQGQSLHYPGELMNVLPLGLGGCTLGVVVLLLLLRGLPLSRGVRWLALALWAGGCLVVTLAGIPLVSVVGALLAGVFVALARPVGALGVLLGLLIVRPWEMPGGEVLQSMPRLFALCTLLSVGVALLRGRVSGLYVTRSTVWFALLISWFLLATLGAAGPTYLGTVELGNFIPMTILFLLIPSVVVAPDDSVLMKEVFVVAVVGAVTAALFTPRVPLPGGGDFARLTGSGLFGNSNDLAALIAVALAFVLVPRIGGVSRQLTVVELAMGAILVVGLWLTQSRGAIIGLVVGALLVAVTGRLRRWSYLLVPLIGCMLVLFFLSVRREEVDLATSQSSRWNYVIAGARMAKAHPLFGVGMENYPRLYERYTPAFDEWGERTAHSSWILALAETGLPGLLLLVAFYLSVLRAAWRIRSFAPEYLGMFVTYGVVMSFLSHTYTLLPYLLGALVLAAARGQSGAALRSGRRVAQQEAAVCF